MSNKACSLLKKIKTKKTWRRRKWRKRENKRAKSEEKRAENIKTLNLGAIKYENSGKVTYIEPLYFFKKEHPLEIDKTLDKFDLNEVKEINKEEKMKMKTKRKKKPKLKT